MADKQFKFKLVAVAGTDRPPLSTNYATEATVSYAETLQVPFIDCDTCAGDIVLITRTNIPVS